jgi:hypothetical protein
MVDFRGGDATCAVCWKKGPCRALRVQYANVSFVRAVCAEPRSDGPCTTTALGPFAAKALKELEANGYVDPNPPEVT